MKIAPLKHESFLGLPFFFHHQLHVHTVENEWMCIHNLIRKRKDPRKQLIVLVIITICEAVLALLCVRKN